MNMKALTLWFVAVMIFSLPDVSHAYINPGSGSVMIQVILAFVFGAAVTIRVFWAKIKTFFDKGALNKNKGDHENKQ